MSQAGNPYAAALLGLGGSIGSAAYGNYAAKSAAQRQWKYARRGWKLGPGMQVQGLRDAGLNPILAAGLGSNTNVGGIGGAQAPTPDFSGSAKGAVQAQTQRKLMQSATALQGEQMRTETFKQEMLREQGAYYVNQARYYQHLAQGQDLDNVSKHMMANWLQTDLGQQVWMMNQALPTGGNVVSSSAKAATGVAAMIRSFLAGGKGAKLLRGASLMSRKGVGTKYVHGTGRPTGWRAEGSWGDPRQYTKGSKEWWAAHREAIKKIGKGKKQR